MIEKILEEAIKPFEKLLTSYRVAICFFSFLILSPNFPNLIFFAASNPSIGDIIETIRTTLTLLNISDLAAVLFICFFASPKISIMLAKKFNGIEIRKQVKTIDTLNALSERDDDYFLYNYETINTNWKLEKETHEKLISFRGKFLEFTISTFLITSILQLKSEIPPAQIIATLIPALLYAPYCSQKNTLEYLEFVAPFKIAETRIRTIKPNQRTPA